MNKFIFSNSGSAAKMANKNDPSKFPLGHGHDVDYGRGAAFQQTIRNEQAEQLRQAADATAPATSTLQVCSMCGQPKSISNFSTVLHRRKSRVCRLCVKTKMTSSSSSSWEANDGSPLLKSSICCGVPVDPKKTATGAASVLVESSSFILKGAVISKPFPTVATHMTTCVGEMA